MLTAILYIRVSTDEQSQNGYSLGYQEQVLRYYCNINNIHIKKVVVEDYSAKSFSRPAWSGLIRELKACKANRPDYILFTLWNRFSRNILEAYQMIKKMQDWKISPQAIEQPLDLSVPENKIILASYLAVAQVENERKSLCVKAGMYSAKMQGRWMGLASIGYCNKVAIGGQKYIAPREPEASLIQEAFKFVAEGIFSIRKVYQIQKNKGLNCSLTTFGSVLRNPVYCGKIIIKNKSTDITVVDGLHEKIISTDVFNKVQSILNKRKSSPFNKSKEECREKLPFRGFLYCPLCSARLTGSASKGRSKRYFYYHCSRGCHFRVNANMVHSLFYKYTHSLQPDHQYIRLFTSIIKKCYKKSEGLEFISQQHTIRKIEDLQEHIFSARSLLLSKDITAREYSEIKLSCEIKIDILKNKLEKVTKMLMYFKKQIEQISTGLSNLYIVFDNCSWEDKCRLIILLYGGEIVWRKSCFLHKLLDSAHIIYNTRQYDIKLTETNMMNDSFLSKEHKFVYDIEARKGHILTSNQIQQILNFLYDYAAITIATFQWDREGNNSSFYIN
ncbi:recombinase family protein [Elizabethkingia anophelis]|nr:recombinase family protein [Elizabethkingia anophelis]